MLCSDWATLSLRGLRCNCGGRGRTRSSDMLSGELSSAPAAACAATPATPAAGGGGRDADADTDADGGSNGGGGAMRSTSSSMSASSSEDLGAEESAGDEKRQSK